jgi:hypothetical protein
MWRWCLYAAWAAVALLSIAAPARAARADDFYQAYAIVTGTDMRQRPWEWRNVCARCLSKYRAIQC